MALTKLTIPPDQASYAVTPGSETLSAKLDGGASRFRLDVAGAASTVNVQWTVDGGKFQYLNAFYNTITKSGSLPFLIDLYLDLPTLTEHECHFIPNSFNFPSQRGSTFVISAQLEVKPDIPDEDYDESLVLLFNEYGSFEAAQAMLDRLAIFANEDMPGSLPG